MNLTKVFNIFLLSVTNEKFKGFQEIKTYVKTDIIRDDKIGCSLEYQKFSKELLMSQYNLKYDNVVFKCESMIDHNGVKYTKRYKELKVPIL